MPLYEVAILEKPTKKEAENGQQEILKFGPMAIVASDEQSAGIIAVHGNKEDIKIDPARIMVLVRPFV